MTFYTAAGRCRIQKEQGRKNPYIQKLGKLYPLSAPEFVIWTSLLWQVMSWWEMKENYQKQMQDIGLEPSAFEETLDSLIQRRLAAEGIGHTEPDALRHILTRAFILPFSVRTGWRAVKALRFWKEQKISFQDVCTITKGDVLTGDEKRIYDLICRIPLSTAEIIRCLERNLTGAKTPEKIMEGLYSKPDSTQKYIVRENFVSPYAGTVLHSLARLYLKRKIILEIV